MTDPTERSDTPGTLTGPAAGARPTNTHPGDEVTARVEAQGTRGDEDPTEGMPDEGPQDPEAIALVNSSRDEDLRGAGQ